MGMSGAFLHCKDHSLTEEQRKAKTDVSVCVCACVQNEDMTVSRECAREDGTHNWRHVKKRREHWGQRKSHKDDEGSNYKQLSVKEMLACFSVAEH